MSWFICVISLILLLLLRPDFFHPDSLYELFLKFNTGIVLAYAIISVIRGFFLIPSTPFVLAGVIMFPSAPWMVFFISMIGIIFSTTALYYFSDLLGFSKKLESKFPKKMEVWKKRLNSPLSTLIVIVWSFFPLVPTDLICYVAGIVKMPFKYLFLGVIVGESVLVYCYVFLGAEIINFFA